MSLGLVGRKRGMTRIFDEDGNSLPVSVVEVVPNRVTQIKTIENDGYSAIQVTAGEKKVSRLKSPEKGHFAKAGVVAGVGLWEMKVSENELEGFSLGSEVTVQLFEKGQKVDVRGVSKGKGFSGVVKRWNFRTQDATHGNSLSHRAPGSIGQNQTPGRVFKGKKMAGQYGNKNVTVQGLEIVRVDSEDNLILIKGSIPGSIGREVFLFPSVKKAKLASEG